MRYYIIIISALILLSTLTACSKDEWIEVQVNNSKIKASFPQIPTQKSTRMTIPGIVEVTATIVELKSENISYTISAIDNLDFEFNFNEINLGPHSFIRRGAVLYDTIDVYLDDIQGKEYWLNFKKKKVIQRIFMDKDRFYTIVIIFKDTHSQEAEIFLNSVKL